MSTVDTATHCDRCLQWPDRTKRGDDPDVQTAVGWVAPTCSVRIRADPVLPVSRRNPYAMDRRDSAFQQDRFAHRTPGKETSLPQRTLPPPKALAPRQASTLHDPVALIPHEN